VSGAADEGVRVLVVDDQSPFRDAAGAVLEAMSGFTVVGSAATGEEGLALARSLRPDLVVLDVKMPVLDGIAAAETIAGERIAPVVILTAFSQRDLVERARDAGAMAYLVKPFSKNDLVPAIEVARARFAELTALDGEVRTLAERLAARQVVEKAKGRLMAERGLSEPDAFRWLQRTAMDERTSMRALAERVLAESRAAEPDSA
jgi:response regulator NasT